MKRRMILILSAAVLAMAFAATCFVVDAGNYEQMSGWQRKLYAIMNREEIINTEYVGKVSDETWSADDVYTLNNTAVLVKEPGEDFVIMNITDLHMMDYSDYEELQALRDTRALSFIGMMAREIQPDLITISGDIFAEDTGSVIYAVHRLSEYLDNLGIPWAPIFDNHDDAANCDDNYIADIMLQYEYCLLKKGDPNMGVGNYIINVSEGDEVVHSILLMDSHGGNVWDNQMEWYKWAIEGVGGVPSTVITHVPLAQYVYAYNEAWDSENDCWKDGYDAFGAKREDECCALDENGEPIDNGFFSLMQSLGSTTNVICGHDHVNNYSILYQGIRLTYSNRIGIGSGESTGSTVLTIHSDGSTDVEHYYVYTDGE